MKKSTIKSIKLASIYTSSLFMILAFMQSTLTAQEFTNKVAGRVMEEKTGRPIADVNVYISETTIGTSTDKDGYYTISKVPSGTHELVASKIGFQSNFKTFTVDKNEEVELTFYLKETVYELEQVKVKDARPDKWISKLEFFKSTLLGNSPFTDDCKFENPEIIEFSGSPAGKLDATAPKPLIITNNALGYKLEILLKSYIWKGNEQRIQYKIQPKFQDITPESKQEYQTWVKNRQEAYEGSIDHLLNSLIENNYKKEGFRIYISILPKKHQKVSQREEIHSAEKILRRFADTKNYVLHFQNFLQVEYGNETSWLKLLYPNVLIDEYGQPHDPVPFERHGAWAESGLSEMLPKYWDTNQEKLDKP